MILFVALSKFGLSKLAIMELDKFIKR